MTFLNWPVSTGDRIIHVLAVITATNWLYNIFKYLSANDKSNPSADSDRQVAKTLFFSNRCSECKHHAISHEPCGLRTCPTPHVNTIIRHLSSARKTLDVCIYLFTFKRIAKVLIEAHRRNVIVRVIIDQEISGGGADQAFELRRAGLRVRSRKFTCQCLMHHKFAIIDGKVLITGSANWTEQAFFGNCENVIITSQRELIDGFSQEYESLWSAMTEEFENQQ